MTKLRIMSDLHLEFGPLDLDPAGEDVLVLAGDIGLGTQGLDWAAAYYRRTGIESVMVAGNHEFYHTPGVRGTLTQFREDPRDGVTFLEDAVRYVAGIRFIGSTLWTDYCLENKPIGAMFLAAKAMNDHRLIPNFKPIDASHKHELSRKFIGYILDTAVPVPTVVMTHHLPSARSIPDEYANNPCNAAYASNLDALVADSGAVLWVHGHTHASCDYEIGGTRVLCNPRGYYPHDTNPRFDPNLVVEV